VIDPRRKAANDERLTKLIPLYRVLLRRGFDGDERQFEDYRSYRTTVERLWPVPPALETLASEAALLKGDPWGLTRALIDRAVEPLRDGLASLPEGLRIEMNGREYHISEPRSARHNLATITAPLTFRTSRALLRDSGDLGVAVNDPGANTPLAIERADYARERTTVIELEHSLWQIARAFGAASNVPYPTRVLLLLFNWHPEAHKPPGAHTMCIRCGTLIYRATRNFIQIPRCKACMKETSKQRAWPSHAVMPAGRGTWWLRCRYPACEQVLEGPRHTRLCPLHTSAKLPPSRRVGRIAPHEGHHTAVADVAEVAEER